MYNVVCCLKDAALVATKEVELADFCRFIPDGRLEVQESRPNVIYAAWLLCRTGGGL
jgi:hypothetical protein